MEYQVPQFIEVEDKVVGPLTLKQFIYLAGAAGIAIVAFVYLPFIFFLLVGLPVVGLAVALSFYKVNGKSFGDVLEAGFAYYTKDKLFLWKRADEKPVAPADAAAKAAASAAAERMQRAEPRLTRGKLSELAWSLDIDRPDGPAAV